MTKRKASRKRTGGSPDITDFFDDVAGGQPPPKPALETAKAHRERPMRIPQRACAVIAMPKTKAQQDAVLTAIDQMRSAGLEVKDQWSVEHDRFSRAFNAQQKMLIKRVEREVRRIIRDRRAKITRKYGLQKFYDIYGTYEDRELDGSLSGAREVYGLFAHEADFDDLVHRIDRSLANKDFVSRLPNFKEEWNGDLKAADDILSPRKPKKRDFSDIKWD